MDDVWVILRVFLGIAIFISIAWLISKKRNAVSWRLVLVGFLLQITFGILITQVGFTTKAFGWLSNEFARLMSFSFDGSKFLFGSLANEDTHGFIFALQVLPTIIFFSSISAGLYYLGVLQRIVKSIAWVMSRTMRLSGPESLSAAGNIFLGQTEAPLFVRPFIQKMTYSELMCLMTGGMATISGGILAGILALWVQEFGMEEREQFATFLLSASVMNAPAAIVFAKIVIPETESEKLNKELNVAQHFGGVNLIDALARGATDGLKLALNVGAMVLVFIALIAALNYLLRDLIGDVTGLNEIIQSSTNNNFDGLTMEYLLGSVFRVFAFLMGVEWQETLVVGSLLGQKTVLNEYIAYIDLTRVTKEGLLSSNSRIIATYALCGFANFSSIAIQIGGIGGMAPDRQGDISKLGIRALVAATLATMTSGAIAGILY